MIDTELFFNIHTHNIRFPNKEIQQIEPDSFAISDHYFSVGIHPEKADLNVENETFSELILHNNCLAIGEIGLDNRFPNSSEIQEQTYISQLKLAEKHKKPVILHCVNSWDRCKFLHQKYAPHTMLIYHGFNKPGIIKTVLDYEKAQISIGSSILTNNQLQQSITSIPVSRLLMETDNSTVNIEAIYEKVADLKFISLREFSEQIRENVKMIFGI